MAVDQSGLRWPAWPVAGAVGAGRQDALPGPPAGFGLTPSGQAEQDNAAQIREILDVPAELLGEVPGAEPEPLG
jgi:hypothetical protein